MKRYPWRVVRDLWRDVVMETDTQGHPRVNRISYELCVLQALRERLRCKEVWVVGADRYRNPDEDVPTDFTIQTYYAACSCRRMPRSLSGSCSKKCARN